MRSLLRSSSVLLVSFALLGACDDPSAGVSAATVTDPAPPPAAAAPSADHETLTIAREGSSVGFTGSKVTGSHDGTFGDFAGTITLAPDVTASSVDVTIQIASLAIEPQRLHDHLLSPELFGAAEFPTAHFQSTAITAGGTGTVGDAPATHTVTGNLTLHGQTHAISFPAVIAVTPTGVTARAEFTIQRQDFGIVYPGMPDDLIRNEVVIRFAVVAPRA
jgi:polyisoprenoid-binding protein YceI